MRLPERGLARESVNQRLQRLAQGVVMVRKMALAHPEWVKLPAHNSGNEAEAAEVAMKDR